MDGREAPEKPGTPFHFHFHFHFHGQGDVIFLAYAAVTALAIAANLGIAIADFARAPFVLANSAEVGMPPRLLPVVAVLKTDGAAGLLIGLLGVRPPGVVAALGLTLFFACALAAHVRAGLPQRRLPRRVLRGRRARPGRRAVLKNGNVPQTSGSWKDPSRNTSRGEQVRMEPLRDADPRRVGRYRLVARLGGGGMGEVFLGSSPGGMTVAVKIVREHLLVGDPAFRQRFAREVAAARLVGGFYTAQVVDADTEAEPPWLATAYIPGPSLHDAVRDRGEPLPEHAVRVLGAGLAEGLAAIHERKVVHRDLTPRNVILADGGPRIIDFGIARALDAAPNPASGVFGTPEYMSPEHAKARPTGSSGDVFSLGSVLTFASTGHSPFAADSPLASLHRVIDDVPDLQDVPAGLLPLIAACLAKDPDGRPDVAEVLARLTSPAEAVTEWLPSDVADMVTGYRTRTSGVLPPTLVYTDPPFPAPEPEPEPAPKPTPQPKRIAPKQAERAAPKRRMERPQPQQVEPPKPKQVQRPAPRPVEQPTPKRVERPKPQPAPRPPAPRPAAPRPAAKAVTNPSPAVADTRPSTPAKTTPASKTPEPSSSDDNEIPKILAGLAAIVAGIAFLHFYVGGAHGANVGDCVYQWNNRVWNKDPCKHPIIGETTYMVTARTTPFGLARDCPEPYDRRVYFAATKKQSAVTLCLRLLKRN